MPEAKHKIIELKYPIPIEGGETKKLKLNRLKLKHLKLLPKDFDEDGKIDINVLIILLSGMTNLPSEAIEEIDSEDLAHISEQMNDFLSKSP